MESELSTEDGDENEDDDDEGNEEFESEESDDAANHDDETRIPGYGRFDDAPQLAAEALFFCCIKI